MTLQHVGVSAVCPTPETVAVMLCSLLTLPPQPNTTQAYGFWLPQFYSSYLALRARRKHLAEYSYGLL